MRVKYTKLRQKASSTDDNNELCLDYRSIFTYTRDEDRSQYPFQDYKPFYTYAKNELTQEVNAGQGIVVLFPCIDRSHKVDLRSQIYNLNKMEVLTSNGAIIEVSISINYCIRDPVASVVGIQDLTSGSRTLFTTVVQRVFNNKEMEDALGDRQREFAEELIDELGKATMAWGLEVRDIQILNVKVLKEPPNRLAGMLESLMPTVTNIATRLAGQNSPSNNQNVPSFMTNLLSTSSGESHPVDPGKLNMTTSDAGHHSPQMFTSSSEEQCQISVERLIESVKPVLSAEMAKAINDDFIISLGDDSDGIYLNFRNGVADICQTSSLGGDVLNSVRDVVEIPPEILLEIMAGRCNPMGAYLKGLISVRGNIFSAAKLKIVVDAIGKYYSSPKNQPQPEAPLIEV